MFNRKKYMAKYVGDHKETKKEYDKCYRSINAETIKDQSKLYYKANKEERKKYQRQYRADNKDEICRLGKEYRESHPEKGREWFKNNPDYTKVYERNRLKVDLNYKIKVYLRSRVRAAIKGNWKSGSAVKDLGCSIDELKLYLEKRFELGMDWNNWSSTGWHIDHVIPLYNFDLTDRGQFLEACHYTNLQPLWAKENLSKGRRYDP